MDRKKKTYVPRDGHNGCLQFLKVISQVQRESGGTLRYLVETSYASTGLVHRRAFSFAGNLLTLIVDESHGPKIWPPKNLGSCRSAPNSSSYACYGVCSTKRGPLPRFPKINSDHTLNNVPSEHRVGEKRAAQAQSRSFSAPRAFCGTFGYFFFASFPSTGFGLGPP